MFNLLLYTPFDFRRPPRTYSSYSTSNADAASGERWPIMSDDTFSQKRPLIHYDRRQNSRYFMRYIAPNPTPIHPCNSLMYVKWQVEP